MHKYMRFRLKHLYLLTKCKNLELKDLNKMKVLETTIFSHLHKFYIYTIC